MTTTTTASRAAMPLLRPAALAFTALALLTGTARPVTAQGDPGRPPHWEFLVSSGTLVPTGAQREAIARGGVTAAQLSFVPGPIALTATLGWARSRDVALPDRPKLDVFLYDLGAEARAPRVRIGRLSLMPYGGTGVGARSYNHRSLEVDATHNLAAFISAGSELGAGRVRLRLEVRNYFTGFKPLDRQGSLDTRSDMVLMAGLRLAPRG